MFKTSILALALRGPLGLAHAQVPRLYVVTPSGNLYSAPPKSGFFVLEAATHVPLHSIVQLGEALYMGSPNGEVRRFSIDTGQVDLAFTVQSDVTSIVVHGDDLLVSGSYGSVVRVDPITGEAILILNVDYPLEALTVDGETLYAGTPGGGFLRADLSAGTPFEIMGTADGPIQSMSQTQTELYLGASEGQVFVYDKLSELAVYAYPVDSDATAIVRDGNNFLIGGSNGLIHRVIQIVGTVQETYVVPEAVSAMWLQQPLGFLQSSMFYASTLHGADIDFSLSVPKANAGQVYLLLGTMSGTEPGIDVPSTHLSLNADSYFNHLLLSAGGNLIPGALGQFDHDGKAAATLSIPPGAAINLSGLELHHAFIVLDPAVPGMVVGTSDPVVTFLF